MCINDEALEFSQLAVGIGTLLAVGIGTLLAVGIGTVLAVGIGTVLVVIIVYYTEHVSLSLHVHAVG